MSDLADLQRLIERPAPRGGGVPARWLFAGLVGGPAAWNLQMLTLYGISSDTCTLTQGAHGQAAVTGFGDEPILLLAINLFSLAVTIAATVLSFSHWRGARNDQANGAGRTRFVAFSGMLAGSIFGLAILFNTLEPIIIPTCWKWR